MVSRQTTNDLVTARRYPIGVEIIRNSDGLAAAHARVWAPNRTSVELVIVDDPGGPTGSKLILQEEGYFSGAVADFGSTAEIRSPTPRRAISPTGHTGHR